jgi:hypothetical protein
MLCDRDATSGREEDEVNQPPRKRLKPDTPNSSQQPQPQPSPPFSLQYSAGKPCANGRHSAEQHSASEAVLPDAQAQPGVPLDMAVAAEQRNTDQALM